MKRNSRKSKEDILRDFFKYPPDIEGPHQERQIREAKRVWKRELHRYQRRKAKDEIKYGREGCTDQDSC